MSKSRIKLHVHQQADLSIMLQMFQRQIFWMSYLPLPKCKFATNLHHICYYQVLMTKLSECEKQCPTNISLVFYNIKVFWEQAAKPQVWDTYSKGNSPSQSKLQVCCKCSTKLQKKPKGHIGAPEYQHYEWNTCWIVFRHVQPSGALLHTLSKVYDVPVCFVAPPSF